MIAGRPIRVHALIDTLTVGGAEVMLVELAAVAEESGIALSVGYLKDHRGSPTAARLREQGVEPVLVGLPRRLGPVAIARVRRHLASAAPDVVHTHLLYADLLGGAAARMLGLPSVSTVHAVSGQTWEAGPLGRIRSRLGAFARRRLAARVVTVSDSARETYLHASGDRPDHAVAVRNGVAPAVAPGAGKAVREELGIPHDAPVVTMLSALRPEKGHATALAAVELLLDSHPGLRLLVVGDGRSAVDVRAAAAPLGEAAVLAGYRADVPAILDATDVLLHPSLHDAFPTTILEAMSAGVPVVATAVGGIPEMVDNEHTGLLLPPQPSPARLAAALSALLDDPARQAQLGAAARERWQQEFTAQRWAGNLAALYREVAARG